MRKLPWLIALLVSTSIACGGSDGGDPSGADAAVGDSDGSMGQPDSGVPDGYEELISGAWNKAPGSDSYYCVWKTLEEDTYINSFAAIAPLGTHHTVLSIANDPPSPNGEGACNTATIGEQLLYASGVGTEPLNLPEGVALKVAAGTTIHLQLHLFNASDSELSGISGTSIRTIPQAEVQHEAEFFFAGTLSFSIPPNGQDYTANGSCAVEADGNLVALWPHMHLIGKHMKVTLEGTELHNAPYDFNEQKFYGMDAPIAVKQGDQIGVECTWNNTGDSTVTFGEGDSTDEMCFSGFYRYPKVGSDPFCGLLNF
jgi:hypothetical protein